MVCGRPTCSEFRVVTSHFFPEVELRLLRKRDWHVVISQEWKFGDTFFPRGTRSFWWFVGDGVCGTC